MDEIIVKQGEVVAIEGVGESAKGSTGGMRIKVRLEQDKGIPVKDLPYAMPLMPRMFHSIPKIGEEALVFTSQLTDKNSQRYYLGPLLSQPQYYEYEKYRGGRGTSNALTDSKQTEPLETIENFPETAGAFPYDSDVAVMGRGGSDIIIRDPKPTTGLSFKNIGDEEILLRCGIRNDVHETVADKNRKGKINFNTTNPAYIQLLYANGTLPTSSQALPSVMGEKITKFDVNPQTNAVINVVADKINLMSHKDIDALSTSVNIAEQPTLLNKENLKKCLESLHNAVYGDVLIEYLELLRQAIIAHQHPFAQKPPTIDSNLNQVIGFNLSDMVSNNIRLS